MSLHNIAAALDALDRAADALKEAKAQYELGKEALKASATEVLVRGFVQLDQKHDNVEDLRKDLNKEILYLSTGVIPDRFTTAKVPSITVEIGNRSFTVGKGYRYSASMIDKAGAIAYLKAGDVNMRALVKEEVNAKTLSSFAKDYVQKQGKELPDDLFKVANAAYTTVRAKA